MEAALNENLRSVRERERPDSKDSGTPESEDC